MTKVEITLGFWFLFSILSEGSDFILIQREMRRGVQESGHIPPVSQGKVDGIGMIVFISPFASVLIRIRRYTPGPISSLGAFVVHRKSKKGASNRT